MITFYFSQATNGFYNSEINGSDIPDDAVIITEKLLLMLLDGQSAGKKIGSDEVGYPILITPEVDNVAEAEYKKAELLTRVSAKTQLWHSQLNLGMIKEADRDTLARWMIFAQELQAIDTSKAPNIAWPIMPVS